MSRKYFSHRKHGTPPLTLEQMKEVFGKEFLHLQAQYYFTERFGGQIGKSWRQGSIESSISSYVLLSLRKDDLWPVDENLWRYTEEDVFDMTEFLYDHVSSPVYDDGLFGDPVPTGDYDLALGRQEFRKRLNPLLEAYSEGYEINEEGIVLVLGEDGLREIFSAKVPTKDSRIVDRVDQAVQLYRDRHSDDVARRAAIRELADVCELLRPNIKEVMLPKDESDLFKIANNYGLRHFNDNQKNNGPEWRSWMFYLYLSTIHLTLRLMQREQSDHREQA